MLSEIITLADKLKVKIYKWGNHQKQTIVLLHGLGSTGISFDELARMLSEEFRVIALDLPGHGGSSLINDNGDISVDYLTEWLKKVIEHYGLNNLHIAGHSIGGYIGLAYAKKHSLNSLILLDGGYIRASHMPENSLREELMKVEQHISNYRFSSWEDYENELVDAGLSNSLIRLSKQSMKENNGQVELIVSSNTAKELVKCTFYEPSDDTLSGIEIPVLLLKSTIPEEFNLVRNNEIHRLKQYMNLNVIDVEGVSHDLYWEAPKYICDQMNKWVINHK
ncbi:alpha/beta hydrolase [Halobacillus rhizosphaerae]|uniref:alpha/beta fold hydrolase n=1 Tax=Halobacillus rhizosphaerae TaxID=3064889 RepID=UPI00398B9122